MAFVKEVTLVVKSTIENIEDGVVDHALDEVSESTVSGFMKPTEDGFFLTYSEDGDGGRTVSDVTVSENSVRVRRIGSVVSDLMFEVGVVHTSIYEVPPYKFDMSVEATKIRNTLSLGAGMLDLFYKMTVGGAEKKVRLRISVFPA
jgi:uncharacterized beta-barrel protein YwiB (DUF1934 family)